MVGVGRVEYGNLRTAAKTLFVCWGTQTKDRNSQNNFPLTVTLVPTTTVFGHGPATCVFDADTVAMEDGRKTDTADDE